MELKRLIEDLSQALYDEMCQGCEDDTSFSGSVPTPHGQIEVYYHKVNGDWNLDVYVYHDDDDNEHETPNLEAYLADKIDIDRDAVEEYWRDYNMDEWQSHGFRDEADFWHWKEGR